MKLFFSKPFVKDYRRLPKIIQNLVNKKIQDFLSIPQPPSLRVKKMEGYYDKWEARITKNYRFTFEISGDLYILRRVGKHDILRHP